MKTFACSDVVPGCAARFVSDTDDEIVNQVARHAAQVHGMPEVPESVVGAVRAHILLVGWQ